MKSAEKMPGVRLEEENVLAAEAVAGTEAEKAPEVPAVPEAMPSELEGPHEKPEEAAEAPKEAVDRQEGERSPEDEQRIAQLRSELAEGAERYEQAQRAKTVESVSSHSTERKYVRCEACGGTGRKWFFFRCGVCGGGGRVVESEKTTQSGSVKHAVSGAEGSSEKSG
ncbi:MAG: hypothetical protein KGI69_00870 [Patescibacteria group bacterium]|nr:hypothetical protein [Patescibacteria group bacterium]